MRGSRRQLTSQNDIWEAHANDDQINAPFFPDILRFPLLLDSHIVRNMQTTKPTFQYCVHLLGEQTMPVYLGIRQFDCKYHILITSRGHCDIRPRLRQLFPSDYSFDCIFVDAFDPAAIRNTILAKLKGIGAEGVGFNLTGGTKLMFASALSTASTLHGHPFYIDADNHDILLLDGSFERFPLKPIDSIDPFFVMNGFAIIEHGHWTDISGRASRTALTNQIAQSPLDIAGCQLDAARFNDHPGKPFRVQRGNFFAELEQNGNALVRNGTYEYSVPAWPDIARYISGGWFEEYCYLALYNSLSCNQIQDLRLCVRVDWLEGKRSNPKFGVQELDIVATDGKRLYIAECKAGAVKSEHLAILKNNVRTYGGVNSIGLLLALFPPHPSTVRKFRASHDCSLFCGLAISEQLPNLLPNLKGGEIYIGQVPCARTSQRDNEHF